MRLREVLENAMGGGSGVGGRGKGEPWSWPRRLERPPKAMTSISRVRVNLAEPLKILCIGEMRSRRRRHVRSVARAQGPVQKGLVAQPLPYGESLTTLIATFVLCVQQALLQIAEGFGLGIAL
jgi:hypothetical protein